MALESLRQPVDPWLLGALCVVNGALLVGPGTAMLFAWDCARNNRPRCIRLARLAMLGSVLSLVCYVVLLARGAPWFYMRDLLGARSGLLAVLQALVFTMAWLATRGPRSSRPFTD